MAKSLERKKVQIKTIPSDQISLNKFFVKKISLESVEINSNEAYRKILFWFFSRPSKGISLNELSLKLKLAKVNAKKLVLELVRENFLNKEEIGKLWRISCNKDHPLNKTLKISYNLEQIFSTNLIKIIKEIIPETESIILFGDYVKGTDDEYSPILMAVEKPETSFEIKELGKFNQIGYRNDVPVILHVYSKDHLSRDLHKEINAGIVLYRDN